MIATADTRFLIQLSQELRLNPPRVKLWSTKFGISWMAKFIEIWLLISATYLQQFTNTNFVLPFYIIQFNPAGTTVKSFCLSNSLK